MAKLRNSSDYPIGNLILYVNGVERDKTPCCTNVRLQAVLKFWRMEYALDAQPNWTVRHVSNSGIETFSITEKDKIV